MQKTRIDDLVPREGQILTGSLFSEPVRVATVRPTGPGAWVLGVVGVSSERYRSVTLIRREGDKIGQFFDEAERGVEGAAGLLKMAEDRHAALVAPRQRRVEELAPARLAWHEVKKVAHYQLSVDALKSQARGGTRE